MVYSALAGVPMPCGLRAAIVVAMARRVFARPDHVSAGVMFLAVLLSVFVVLAYLVALRVAVVSVFYGVRGRWASQQLQSCDSRVVCSRDAETQPHGRGGKGGPRAQGVHSSCC